MGILLVHHDPDQRRRSRGKQDAHQYHHHGEVFRNLLDEDGGNQERREHPEAVDEAFHCRRGEGYGEVEAIPVGQQVAADQLAHPQRQHFVGEQADVDGLHGSREAEFDDGFEQCVPANAVGEIDRKIAEDCARYPPPVEGADGGNELVEIVAVEHPEEAYRR
ncbi:MAG: hypothetical protein WDO73_14680 [Ignavibacteriota bacterium]